MTLQDHYYRKVPKYYNYMYLDGFTPEEIMYAFRRDVLYPQIEERR